MRIAVAIIALYALCAAQTSPGWMDITPPVVRAEPSSGTYNHVVTATFVSNEQGTVFVSTSRDTGFAPYTRPMPLVWDGVQKLYFYGEDLYGNRTPLDSAVYAIDTRAPSLAITPAAGVFRAPVTVSLSSDEPVTFHRHATRADTPGTAVTSTFTVSGVFEGLLSATDFAGNRTFSEPQRYEVKVFQADVRIAPDGGRFHRTGSFSLSSSPVCTLYYTMDPLALPTDFRRYSRPVRLPPGTSLVRYFGVGEQGWSTPIAQATFLVDTASPRVRMRLSPGSRFDTLRLSAIGASRIHYTLDGRMADITSPVYTDPLVVPRDGRARLYAFAIDDSAGQSEMLVWEHKYDIAPPSFTMTPAGGTFTRAVRVAFTTSEPAEILYTTDASEPGPGSLVCTGGLALSRQGKTLVRAVAIDRAGNMSAEKSALFVLDSVPPVVKVRVEGNPGDSVFRVSLVPSEEATIRYTIGSQTVQPSSPVYDRPLLLRPGQAVAYVAGDRAGNLTPVTVFDELRRPAAAATPSGGVYSRPVHLAFGTTLPSSAVFWRLLPDTVFRPFQDTIPLNESGQYTIEYYAEGPGGNSPLRREEYAIDMNAPRVKVVLRKGTGDTAYVLFECSENATVFYTTDGTSPLDNGPSVRTAAGKYARSNDRVKVVRTPDARLAYFAEDVAGNQSSVSIVELYKPAVVPSIPAGETVIYDRVLSVSLFTWDDGRIYYARHGHAPTVDSATFTAPITVAGPDTISAFAVDQSGAVGDVSTFVYLVDLPPVASFTVTPPPDSVAARTPVRFDAGASVDRESAPGTLRYRWDFDGDGAFDTRWDSTPVSTHAYANAGVVAAKLEVRDERGRTAVHAVDVPVQGACPEGMVYVAQRQRRGFCIDRFEYPNRAGERPRTRVSWVSAKMTCLDDGKRLCTAAEWEMACRGKGTSYYPYGTEYAESRCADQADKPYPAGSFAQCGEGYGLRDMVGNVWEWVEDKSGRAPLQKGGSHRMGPLSHCAQTTEGRVSTESAETGFRCCK